MERTCDACGRQFKFTYFQHDRCPHCCPKDESIDPWEDDLSQESDVSYRPDEAPEQFFLSHPSDRGEGRELSA
jgi:hypothetical protein